jgi:pimeloyl-ACP methyl ester carboxylesterase
MPTFARGGATLHYAETGLPQGEQIVWAHGWGQDHTAFLAMAGQLAPGAQHLLVDFPGFGRSPPPPAAWGTAEYADLVADWLATLPRRRRVWIGHSFGCRVGMQLAARHPEAVDALILLSAAGLPPRRGFFRGLRLKARLLAFKLLRRAAALGLPVQRWQDRFGSSDYRAAGALRGILVKVVNEDLTEEARRIRCPTLLVYGADDRDTPPEMGRRLERLIPGARLVVLDGVDHHSILGSGRHQALHRMVRFLTGLSPVTAESKA